MDAAAEQFGHMRAEDADYLHSSASASASSGHHLPLRNRRNPVDTNRARDEATDTLSDEELDLNIDSAQEETEEKIRRVLSMPQLAALSHISPVRPVPTSLAAPAASLSSSSARAGASPNNAAALPPVVISSASSSLLPPHHQHPHFTRGTLALPPSPADLSGAEGVSPVPLPLPADVAVRAPGLAPVPEVTTTATTTTTPSAIPSRPGPRTVSGPIPTTAASMGAAVATEKRMPATTTATAASVFSLPAAVQALQLPAFRTPAPRKISDFDLLFRDGGSALPGGTAPGGVGVGVAGAGGGASSASVPPLTSSHVLLTSPAMHDLIRSTSEGTGTAAFKEQQRRDPAAVAPVLNALGITDHREPFPTSLHSGVLAELKSSEARDSVAGLRRGGAGGAGGDEHPYPIDIDTQVSPSRQAGLMRRATVASIQTSPHPSATAVMQSRLQRVMSSADLTAQRADRLFSDGNKSGQVTPLLLSARAMSRESLHQLGMGGEAAQMQMQSQIPPQTGMNVSGNVSGGLSNASSPGSRSSTASHHGGARHPSIYTFGSPQQMGHSNSGSSLNQLLLEHSNSAVPGPSATGGPGGVGGPSLAAVGRRGSFSGPLRPPPVVQQSHLTDDSDQR